MFKTGLLMAAITALFLAAGYALGGESGMMMALMFALATNFFSYWFSDKIVLSMYRAQPIDPAENPRIYALVERLARNANIPMPKAYIIDSPQPNAFATGRNPQHGALAMTTGLLDMLDERELAAVLSHEMGHIRNYDTLIMTVTATIAGAIGMLANFAFFFGGRRDEQGNRVGGMSTFLIAILAPLAATLVQFAISRTREYGADAAGAEISEDPLALASALRKISGMAQRISNAPAEENPATAHMFIINPLHGGGIGSLFSTHPDTEGRIAALEHIARVMSNASANALTNSQLPHAGASKGPWG